MRGYDHKAPIGHLEDAFKQGIENGEPILQGHRQPKATRFLVREGKFSRILQAVKGAAELQGMGERWE